jgi:hypothetical protein
MVKVLKILLILSGLIILSFKAESKTKHKIKIPQQFQRSTKLKPIPTDDEIYMYRVQGCVAGIMKYIRQKKSTPDIVKVCYWTVLEASFVEPNKSELKN